MTTISPNWNTDLNYWDLHPAIKTFALFNNFYSSDKSKDKESSSKIMWAIALYIDPSDKNPWRTTNPIDKQKLIAEDYLNNKEFNWEDPGLKQLIEEYKDKCLTVAEKALVELEEKLADRARFIKETTYTLDYYEETERGWKLKKGTADQLDKMMVNTKKIYDQYELIKQQMQKESINGVIKGGAIESASEKGEL
jgi:hypothetical protein